MPNTSALLDSLSEFARDLTAGFGTSETLRGLAERVTELLALAGVGVLLRDGDRVRFGGALNDMVAALERVQEEHQVGPSVEVATTGIVVTVSDLENRLRDDDWPAYCEAAHRSGIRAVAGVPMIAESRLVGAMSLYDAQPRSWSADELRAARILSDVATSYLVHASELERERRSTEQLQRALDSRILIEQAKGILAATHGVSVDEAFNRLRRHARNHNADIHDVAQAVVTLGLRV